MSEIQELNRMGAKPQPNSGRGKHKKGDGILDDTWLIDVKESAKSFSLNTRVWGKVCTDAAQTRHEPMLLVVLGEEGQSRTRLVVHTQDDFKSMKEELEMLRQDVTQLRLDLMTERTRDGRQSD